MDGITVHGIDASEEMINQCESKDIYSNLHLQFLGEPENFERKNSEYLGQCDYVVGSGILSYVNCGADVLKEMNMACKEGGYIIFTISEVQINEHNYGGPMDDMVENGSWKLIESENYTKFPEATTEDGCYYKKINSVIRVYQKISH